MSNRWQAVAGDLFRQVSELEVIKIKSEARIAELEAARDVLIFERDSERNRGDANGKSWLGTATRVAELEAERDRLKAALEPFAQIGTGLAEHLTLLDEVRAAVLAEREACERLDIPIPTNLWHAKDRQVFEDTCAAWRAAIRARPTP